MPANGARRVSYPLSTRHLDSRQAGAIERLAPVFLDVARVGYAGVMGERPSLPAKSRLDLRAIEARIAQRRRDVVIGAKGMLRPAPAPEEPATAPAIAETPDPPGAPRRVGRIADVEHVEAPYRPPPGASRTARPIWTVDGENTGRLVLREVGTDAPRLPPTLEIALPDEPEDATPAEPAVEPRTLEHRAVELRPAIPETRQILVPEAAERTAVLGADAVHLPIGGPPSPSPPRRGYEKTDVLSEAQLRGEEPVRMRRSLYDEVTFVLPASALESDDDEPTLLDLEDLTEPTKR